MRSRKPRNTAARAPAPRAKPRTMIAPRGDDAAASHRVVLIGIDGYSGKIPALGGCVNDIDSIQEVLLRRLGVPADRIVRLAAPSNDGVARPTAVPTLPPTRANVVAALTKLGDEAKPGDRVFIYYSGHGTHLEVIDPRGGASYYREALVPIDVRAIEDQEPLLFDWELNALIGRIADRTPAVTVVLDCCCSAGATRELPEKGVRVRFVPATQPFRLTPAIPPPSPTHERGVMRGLGANPRDFMVTAACLDNEKARESTYGPEGEPPKSHGLMTRAILDQLRAIADPDLSELRWGRIWRAVLARIETLNPFQHPWLSSNPARRVFGGPAERGDLGYAVIFDAASATYRLDAGSLVGVTEGALVALYPPMTAAAATAVFPPLDTPEDLKQRIGLLRVISAGRAVSEAVADPAKPPPSPLPADARGRLVQLGKSARLRVALKPLDPRDDSMARRLAASSYVEIVNPGDGREMMLVQRADKSWAMTDDIYGTGEESGPPVPTLIFVPNAVVLVGEHDVGVRLVEHFYRYARPLRAGRNCTDLPHGLVMRLLDASSLDKPLPPDKAQNPDLPALRSGDGANYHLKAGRYDRATGRLISPGDTYAIQIDNTTDLDLWITLFNCDSDGRVGILASRAFIQRRARATFWSSESDLGDPITAVLSPDQALGVDRYVAIGTTDRRASLDYLELSTSFADVANGVNDKAAQPTFGASERWTATFAVVRMTPR